MIRRLALLALFPVAAACGDDGTTNPGTADAAAPATLTYYQHVKPVIDAKCTQCHVTGGIAPFPLTEYDHFEDLGGMVKEAVTTKLMPPWLAADDCNDYFGDRSLTDEHIALISDWVDQGMAAGDPGDVGAPLDVETVQLSREDLTLTMPVEYVPQVEPDDYRCFLIDWPETEVTYVTGFRANPGDARVVHHVIAFYIPPDQAAEYEQLDANEEGPGYTCFGGPGGGGMQATGWLGSWAPGGMGSDYPAGTGYRVEPGAKVALQVHYNTLTAGVLPDQTSVDFKIDPSVDKEAFFLPYLDYLNWLGGDGMLIPAGEADVMHSFSQDMTQWISFISDPDQGGPAEPIIPSGPFTIHAVGLHMHTLGTSATLRVDRATGDDTCLLDIPRWDFHWQGGYGLREPVTVNPGDELYIECHWDNTAGNQQIVDGVPLEPQNVTWGEGTVDEMCLGGLYITSAL